MSEKNLNDYKQIGKKQTLPDIKIRQSIPQLKENINQKEEKEESNSYIILDLSKEKNNPFSEKLFETDNYKKKSDIEGNTIKNNSKIMEKINSLDNKLYFTETNIRKNVTAKSRISKLYTIDVIPEYPINSKINTKILSSNKSKKSNENKKTDKNNSSIFSQEVELKKRVVNKYNFLPLQHRIKEIEEQIKKQNEYDFQKTMKELQVKYEQKQKKKERDKIISEKNKKFKKKLKQMEEIRNNLINQKLIKIMKKKNRPHKKAKSKSFNFFSNEKNNIQKNHNTIDIYSSEKEDSSLPPLQYLSRLEYVRQRKQRSEVEFCNQVQQKLQENEENHRRNYLNRLNSMNNKYLHQEKLFRERSYNCLEHVKIKDDEFKENYFKKEMIKSYKINKIIAQAKSIRKIKIDKIKSKNYNVKEKQELIEKKLEEKNYKYQKKIKEQNNSRNKTKMNLNYYNTEKMQKKILFHKKQKENLINLNEEMKEYYKDLKLKHGDNVMIINDLQKKEGIIRDEVVKRTIGEQIKKIKEIQNLSKFSGKMKNENINNYSEDKVQKIFNHIRLEEQKKIDSETDIFT